MVGAMVKLARSSTSSGRRQVEARTVRALRALASTVQGYVVKPRPLQAH
jgi:hypothetical protein